jgi:hypothetical protein
MTHSKLCRKKIVKNFRNILKGRKGVVGWVQILKFGKAVKLKPDLKFRERDGV